MAQIFYPSLAQWHAGCRPGLEYGGCVGALCAARDMELPRRALRGRWHADAQRAPPLEREQQRALPCLQSTAGSGQEWAAHNEFRQGHAAAAYALLLLALLRLQGALRPRRLLPSLLLRLLFRRRSGCCGSGRCHLLLRQCWRRKRGPSGSGGGCGRRRPSRCACCALKPVGKKHPDAHWQLPLLLRPLLRRRCCRCCLGHQGARDAGHAGGAEAQGVQVPKHLLIRPSAAINEHCICSSSKTLQRLQ